MTSSDESTSVEAVAPWWQTVLVLAFLGLASLQSAMHHGLPGFALPGLNMRLSSYLCVIASEWVLVLLLWLALERRGIKMRSLIGGRWATAGSFFKDLGLGCVFVVVGAMVIGVISHLLGGNTDKTLETLLPKSGAEVVVWVALSATAGFCEEIIFRGYLMRQFRAWSGSWVVAVIAQGAAFGLAHGYYLRAMIAIATYGWLLGLLAYWRNSVRPGMIAHGLQDALGGVLAFMTVK